VKIAATIVWISCWFVALLLFARDMNADAQTMLLIGIGTLVWLILMQQGKGD